MRQIFSVRFFAAVGAAAALLFLLTSVFASGSETTLAELKYSFSSRLKIVQSQMYDEMVSHVVRRALMPEHSVQIVNSAEAALKLFRRGDRFDVVLCDLMMPQITGMELFRMLQALDPNQAARVVFMTGGAFTPSARVFLDSVPNGRLEKPFEIAALRALVNQLLL